MTLLWGLSSDSGESIDHQCEHLKNMFAGIRQMESTAGGIQCAEATAGPGDVAEARNSDSWKSSGFSVDPDKETAKTHTHSHTQTSHSGHIAANKKLQSPCLQRFMAIVCKHRSLVLLYKGLSLQKH